MKRLLIIISLLALPTACSLTSMRTPPLKAIVPNAVTIPVKAWIVLASNETVGNIGNKGCRFTYAHASAFIENLQKNSFIYGQNVEFIDGTCVGGFSDGLPCDDNAECIDGVCDHTPEKIFDPNLLPDPFSTRTRLWQDWHYMVPTLNWADGRINIYFVGNVQESLTPPPPGTLDPTALTLDPGDANTVNMLPPWILVNDMGYDTDSGFHHIYHPTVLVTMNVLEHEMTHYLARFRNRVFGSNPTRTYDNGEHVVGSPNNVLTPFFPPPCPLIIPGRWDVPGTEEHEIWQRISTGTWNNP